MASRGGASMPGEGTPTTAGKSPGGATGNTPGSGKRKHRKKNSPKQKVDQQGVLKIDKLVVEGENTAETSPKTEHESKLSKSDNKSHKIEDKFCKIESESKDSDMKVGDVVKDQSKIEGLSQKQPEGAKQNPGKGQTEKGQGQGEKGQGKGQNQGKVKVEHGLKTGECQGATGDVPPKSKAELKAERRAKQEAQRAAKEKKKTESSSTSSPAAVPVTNKKEIPRVPDNVLVDVEGTRKKMVKKLEKQRLPVRTVAQRKVRLFNHLHQYEREASLTRSLTFSSSGIHPAIVKLGLQYAEGIISGSNARCIGLLAALKKVIDDYTTPPHKELSRDLEAKIKPYISFLTQCRPLSVSMGNAVKFIKWQITNIPGDMSDMRAKEIIKESIDKYWIEKIKLAGVAISEAASSKIADDDVIVVYACSSLIRKVLCDAHQRGKKFRVIVVDGRPRLEGKEMLRRLVQVGIRCSYVLINAASYIMKEATKVLMGAHGLLANGFVMSRVGSSMIALIAKSVSVPVLVCCETYKFCKRVQTDSFVCNELGDPDDLVEIGKKDPYLMDWRDYQSLSLLNLVYDVTPPEFISMVITEIGMIPCTSVPVVLRVKQSETNEV